MGDEGIVWGLGVDRGRHVEVGCGDGEGEGEESGGLCSEVLACSGCEGVQGEGSINESCFWEGGELQGVGMDGVEHYRWGGEAEKEWYCARVQRPDTQRDVTCSRPCLEARDAFWGDGEIVLYQGCSCIVAEEAADERRCSDDGHEEMQESGKGGCDGVEVVGPLSAVPRKGAKCDTLPPNEENGGKDYCIMGRMGEVEVLWEGCGGGGEQEEKMGAGAREHA